MSLSRSWGRRREGGEEKDPSNWDRHRLEVMWQWMGSRQEFPFPSEPQQLDGSCALKHWLLLPFSNNCKLSSVRFSSSGYTKPANSKFQQLCSPWAGFYNNVYTGDWAHWRLSVELGQPRLGARLTVPSSAPCLQLPHQKDTRRRGSSIPQQWLGTADFCMSCTELHQRGARAKAQPCGCGLEGADPTGTQVLPKKHVHSQVRKEKLCALISYCPR